MVEGMFMIRTARSVVAPLVVIQIERWLEPWSSRSACSGLVAAGAVAGGAGLVLMRATWRARWRRRWASRSRATATGSGAAGRRRGRRRSLAANV